MFNILNGGKHAQDSTDFQEFMVMPVGVATFSDALRAGSEIFSALRGSSMTRAMRPARATKAASRRHWPRTRRPSRSSSGPSNEPGTSPAPTSRSRSIRPPSELVEPGSGQGGAPTRYVLAKEGRTLESAELVDLWADWVGRYPIVSLEDGLAEDDWAGWATLTERLGKLIQIVGDDLLVTNTTRIERAIEADAANSVLIKLNQIGTLSETIEAIELARGAGWSAVVSHRSGETEDTTIADLVVGMGTGQIKTGAPSRSERVAKYNRLLRIEGELGDAARYPGRSALSGS